MRTVLQNYEFAKSPAGGLQVWKNGSLCASFDPSECAYILAWVVENNTAPLLTQKFRYVLAAAAYLKAA